MVVPSAAPSRVRCPDNVLSRACSRRPTSSTWSASRASRSCRQEYATARSRARSVPGVARTMSRAKPYSSSPGSASSAVVRKPSEGTNRTVKGAARRNAGGEEGGGGADLGRVAAGGEGVDVGAQLAGVHLPPLVADRLVGGLHRLDVAGE